MKKQLQRWFAGAYCLRVPTTFGPDPQTGSSKKEPLEVWEKKNQKSEAVLSITHSSEFQNGPGISAYFWLPFVANPNPEPPFDDKLVRSGSVHASPTRHPCVAARL